MKYRIYLKDNSGTCLRSKVFDTAVEAFQELPEFTKRCRDYMLLYKLDEYKIIIEKEI